MSIKVTIDGLDTEVDVSLVPSLADMNPETYVALRGLKGDKGDDGIVGRDGTDGTDGVGITSITQNLDGTLSINLDDGTSYVTEPLKGEKGDKGDTGAQGERGVQGERGEQGIQGIQGERGLQGDKGDKGDTGDAFTYDDFTPAQLETLKGEKGDKGDTGATGATGASGNGIADITKTSTSGLVDTYTITFDDGSTETFSVTNGSQGAKGDKGDTGATGNGIASAVLNADYTLTLTFTNGTSYTTSSIRGAKGEKGDKGDKGDAGDVDTAMSSSSTLPVQNRVIKAYVDNGLSGKANTSHDHSVSDITDFPSLAPVATSGDYADLSNKPSIPSKTSDLTNDIGFITNDDDTTYTLTKSGNTITLTGSDGSSSSVTDSNTTYSAMTQAQATAGTSTTGYRISPKVLHDTIENALPTKVSELDNDAGYLTQHQDISGKSDVGHKHTKSDITDFSHTHTKSEITDFSHTHTKSEITDFPTDVSAFNNDAGYLSQHQDISGKMDIDDPLIDIDSTAVSGIDKQLYDILAEYGWWSDIQE